LGDGDNDDFLAGDKLLDIIEELPPGLECLRLNLGSWNERMSEIIAKTSTRCLGHLVLMLGEDFMGPIEAPDDFVASIDSGNRCIEGVIVMTSSYMNITETWCAKLQPILDLNRQRRLHWSELDSIHQGELLLIRKMRLIRCVDKLDVETLFGFLVRNEFHLQQLFKECASK
jgi:hypothetical protein